MGKIGKDTWAILLVFAALSIALVATQIFGDHSLPKLSPAEKVANGIYDPDAVIYAGEEFDKEITNGTFLGQDSQGLRMLAYLAEGAKCFPDKVDIVRVRMRANTALGPLDSAPSLSDDQYNDLVRIKDAMMSLSEPRSGISQISAASFVPGGIEKVSPVETNC